MTGSRKLDEILSSGYVLEFEDRFEGQGLDRSHWVPHYLPHWSSRERSAARYQLSEGCLHLLIERDQDPWCPELDGPTRVSSLQTGVFTGPVGSAVGQHRFHPDAIVREEQENVRLYTPQFGAFVLRAQAVPDRSCMVALWMIGYEDRPERSGEICICEIFGRNVDRGRSASIGMGVHPFGDPSLSNDFEEVPLSIDVEEFHEYAAQWTPEGVTFFVDGHPVRAVTESPSYPMQVMLGIYEFGERTTGYPKRFTIDSFRAYRPEGLP